MKLSIVQRILGILLMVFSLSMLPPAVVGWYYMDSGVGPFLTAFAILAVLGLVVQWVYRRLSLKFDYHQRRSVYQQDLVQIQLRTQCCHQVQSYQRRRTRYCQQIPDQFPMSL